MSGLFPLTPGGHTPTQYLARQQYPGKASSRIDLQVARMLRVGEQRAKDVFFGRNASVADVQINHTSISGHSWS